jgi:hypothetical protein
MAAEQGEGHQGDGSRCALSLVDADIDVRETRLFGCMSKPELSPKKE